MLWICNGIFTPYGLEKEYKDFFFFLTQYGGTSVSMHRSYYANGSGLDHSVMEDQREQQPLKVRYRSINGDRRAFIPNDQCTY
jgi:hypothetical protein